MHASVAVAIASLAVGPPGLHASFAVGSCDAHPRPIPQLASVLRKAKSAVKTQDTLTSFPETVVGPVLIPTPCMRREPSILLVPCPTILLHLRHRQLRHTHCHWQLRHTHCHCGFFLRNAANAGGCAKLEPDSLY